MIEVLDMGVGWKVRIFAIGVLVSACACGQQSAPGGLDLSKLDPDVVAEGMKMLQQMSPEERKAALKSVQEVLGQSFGKDADLSGLSVDTKALAEGVKVMRDAIAISEKAAVRERQHAAELTAKGIAEVPASRAAVRYKIDTHGLGDLFFDDWGEFYIDRRFLTASEMKRVKEIEAFVWKYVIEPLQGAKVLPSSSGDTTSSEATRTSLPRKRAARTHAGGAGLPVFRGFEDARYQEHDALIAMLVAEFNANKAKGCGGTAAQAAKIANLTPAMVKSHMIEEAGGNGPRSKAAWAVDPLQVNVPGDWGKEKEEVGLKKPSKRNEGTAEQNVRAAIMYLSRKGFSAAARPAAERPKGFFDGWPTALRRYNGRRDRTDTDRYYSEEYADKIVRRAANPDLFVPIEIKLAK